MSEYLFQEEPLDEGQMAHQDQIASQSKTDKSLEPFYYSGEELGSLCYQDRIDAEYWNKMQNAKQLGQPLTASVIATQPIYPIN